METFTVSIPNELKKEIDNMSDINWAEYIKKRFIYKIKELQKFEDLKKRGNI